MRQAWYGIGKSQWWNGKSQWWNGKSQWWYGKSQWWYGKSQWWYGKSQWWYGKCDPLVCIPLLGMACILSNTWKGIYVQYNFLYSKVLLLRPPIYSPYLYLNVLTCRVWVIVNGRKEPFAYKGGYWLWSKPEPLTFSIGGTEEDTSFQGNILDIVFNGR